MEVLRERRKIREEVIEKAREWARGLSIKATVLLVGSYARGDFNLWSDVDIMVIAEFNERLLERLKDIDRPPGFEVIPLTPKEFTRLVEKKNPLALEALNTGIVVRNDLDVKEYSMNSRKRDRKC